MAPTLSEVLTVCDGTRDDFNNWNRRALLREKIPETTPGVARPMTRSAALEVAFMVALTDVGFDAGEAASRAGAYVAQNRAHKLDPWLIYEPVTDRSRHLSDAGAKTPIANMVATMGKGEGSREGDTIPKSATRYVVVHLAEIVRRIDALFQKDTD